MRCHMIRARAAKALVSPAESSGVGMGVAGAFPWARLLLGQGYFLGKDLIRIVKTLTLPAARGMVLKGNL